MYLVLVQFRFPLWAHARAGEQVDDACPLATMAALSFDAKQAQKAEWYTAYPKVRLGGLPKHDVIRRRAKALPLPPPSLPLLHKDDSRAGVGVLRHLDAREFSAFAAITCSAVGSGRATMSMIADVALQELRWQLHVMQPLCIGLPIPIDDGDEDNNADADSERRRGLSIIPGSPASTRALSPELVASSAGAGAAAHVPAAHLDGLHDDHMSGKKRKRSAATPTEVAEAPESPRPPPEKKAKRGSGNPHRGRSDRGTRGAIDASHEGSLKPPTGPAAAFLYALGMQSAARERTVVERRRGGGKWR